MTKKDFPAKVKRIRASTGLTLKGFGKLLNIHWRTVQAAERGESKKLSGPLSTLIDLCEHPEVIHRLRIMRGMDVDGNQCKLCKYFDTCTTKGGPNCQSFKIKKVIFTRRQPWKAKRKKSKSLQQS